MENEETSESGGSEVGPDDVDDVDLDNPDTTHLFERLEAAQMLQELAEEPDPSLSGVGQAMGSASSATLLPNMLAPPAAVPAGHDAEAALLATPPPGPGAESQGGGQSSRGAVAGPRVMAACNAHVPGGRLAFYESTGCFQATCDQHPSCSITRIGRKAKASLLKPSKGKPLGLMVAWLQKAAECPTKQAHKALLPTLDLATRKAARQRLLQEPSGADLVSFEKDPETGEPELLDGLL